MDEGATNPEALRFEHALTQAAASDWSDRVDAARILKHHVDRPAAFRKLVEMLDDRNLAVIEEAVESLVASGLPGMREVLKALYEGEDDAGYHIRDRLNSLWLDGMPILEWSRQLAGESESASVRAGAAEIISQVGPAAR
ncbi:MAG: hypothetical protein V7637_3389 [Mycobacteriales bacterium]|jgi:HEAT repeat protein